MVTLQTCANQSAASLFKRQILISLNLQNEERRCTGMKLAFLTVAIAAGLESIHARSISYRMKSFEPKACFHAVVEPNVQLSNALLQFYFSASSAKGSDVVYVDAEVQGPDGKQLYKQIKQTHAEINIKPPQHGDYSLCLTHHGMASDKNIDLDITLPTPPATSSLTSEAVKLENTVSKLQRELSDLVHTLRYVKNRERRNLETTESIENWIFYISTLEVVLIVGMSLLQVTVLRTFFTGSGKHRV